MRAVATWRRVLLPLVLFPLLAMAQEEGPDAYDRVRFEAVAGGQVPNDTMEAVVGTVMEGVNPTRLAGQVNELMAWALKEAEGTPTVEAETLDYSTVPIYRDGRSVGWRASYSLRLTSPNFPALSELLGRMQERLQLRGIDFSVSPETRREAEDRLITEAIAAFRQRADLIRTTLGKSRYRIVSMEVTTSGGEPRPLARMTAEMAAPPVSPGDTRIEARVWGTVQVE